jgi:hypothetical protein
MQTSRQRFSIPQLRLAASPPGCRDYPATPWANAIAASGVANCIRYRNTIVPDRAPSPTIGPGASQALASRPVGIPGIDLVPSRDWHRRVLSRESEKPLRAKEVGVPNVQGQGPRMVPERQRLLPGEPIAKTSAKRQPGLEGTSE